MPKSTISTTELINAILDIDSDEDLRRLSDTIHTRHRQLVEARANTLASQLRVGDRVRIGKGISPKYLEGVTGVVDGPASQSRVPIRPDHPELLGDRYVRPDGTIHAPTSVIEIVEAAGEQDGGEQ